MNKCRITLKRWDGPIAFVLMLGLCFGIYKILFGLHAILPFGKGDHSRHSQSNVQWVKSLAKIKESRFMSRHSVRPIKPRVQYKSTQHKRKRLHKKRRVKRNKRRTKHYKTRVKHYKRRHLTRKVRESRIREVSVKHKRRLVRSDVLPGIFKATYNNIQ